MNERKSGDTSAFKWRVATTINGADVDLRGYSAAMSMVHAGTRAKILDRVPMSLYVTDGATYVEYVPTTEDVATHGPYAILVYITGPDGSEDILPKGDRYELLTIYPAL
jgi:hypothetical protein